MLFAPGLLVVLAGLVDGPIGDFLTLFVGGASLGAIASAWISMVAACLHRQSAQSRRSAFFSANLERWVPEGLAIGSVVGFVLAVLDASVLA